jgi:hypothetical protein
MRHGKALELLPLYSLDALERDDQRAVESHVARCRICQEELRGYAFVASALSGEMELSLSVWDGILERIQAV